MNGPPSKTPASPAPYRGRFAPTPSGPLHLGSLLTALASFLRARRQGGRWLLRIDDLDTARVARGAEAEILRQLEAHGLHWDEPPRRQSACVREYGEALQRLRSLGLVYACDCSRARLQQESRQGGCGAVYSGRCKGRHDVQAPAALRIHVGDEPIRFDDGWQGAQPLNTAMELGDFVVWRRDDVPAYQLACAVDEASQGITEVVRGVDLLDSTFRQLYLMRRLDRPPPAYLHLPVLVDVQGQKLSKQHHAPPLDTRRSGENLLRCLAWLGQRPPPALARAPATQLLEWALAHWRCDRVPRQRTVKAQAL